MRELFRGLGVLCAAAAAALLALVAARLNLRSTGGYWAAMGLLAVGGLAVGLVSSGLAVRRARPRLGALLLGFVPALVAAGWVLLAAAPDGSWSQRRFSAWGGQLGIADIVRHLGTFRGVLAFALGVLLVATAAPRRQPEAVGATNEPGYDERETEMEHDPEDAPTRIAV